MSILLASKYSLALLLLFALDALRQIVTVKLCGGLAEGHVVFLALTDYPGVAGVPFLIADCAFGQFAGEVNPVISESEGFGDHFFRGVGGGVWG